MRSPARGWARTWGHRYVVTSIDGVQFDTGWAGRVETQYGDQTIQVIGRADLVANKRASGRPQDLLDVELRQRHS